MAAVSEQKPFYPDRTNTGVAKKRDLVGGCHWQQIVGVDCVLKYY